VLELALDNTRITMRFCYAPPYDTHVSPTDFCFRLVDVCYPLTEVEFGVLLRGDTFDLKERCIGTGVTLPPLVPKDAALCVETSGAHY